MAHFIGEGAPVNQPELAHDCCDICAKQCDCQLCVVQSANVEVSMESTPASTLSSAVKHAIMASLIQRYGCVRIGTTVRCEGVVWYPRLYFVESCGQCHMSMLYLLQLGISDEHAVNILCIVNSYI